MSFSNQQNDEVMSEINMTPLVDVMLVLLIIFIITIPVINHAVKLDLPKASNTPINAKPNHINLEIDSNGTVSWEKQVVTPEQLKEKIQQTSQQQPQPEVHLWADKTTQYQHIAQVMSAMQTGGLSKIGFVTDPR